MLWNDEEKYEEKNQPDDIDIELMIPAEDVDLKAYNRLLDMAFKHHEANNIAVTGIHGAGKSSILNTYQKNNPDKKLIFISLANLTTISGGGPKTKSPDKAGISQDMKRKLLEDRIYKQLKYYSNRTWKTEAIKKTCWRIVLGILSSFWLLCIAYLLRFQEWNLFYEELDEKYSFLNITTKKESFLIILFVWIILSFILWMVGISKIKNITLELKGGKITWEQKEEMLLGLRERTDEIVQMIQRQKVDGIVFEDLDRYPDMIASVIENLLDINRLVNTCNYNRIERHLKHFFTKKQKKGNGETNTNIVRFLVGGEIAMMIMIIWFCKMFPLPLFLILCAVNSALYLEFRKWNRHVLFFYVCSNEMLKNEDTIKYFNMQIPVVPVLSRINVEKILKEQLNKALEPSDSDKLSFILSKYLDNYNQIKDIIMNFYVYYCRLGEVGQDELGLDKAKMFAIIAYKAFFPKDFTEVQRGNDSGYLDYVFKKYSTSNVKSVPGRRFRDRVLKNELEGKSVLEIRKMLTENIPKSFNGLIRNPNFNLIIELIKEGLLDEAYEDYIAYIYGGNDEIRERRFIEALSNEGKAYGYQLENPESVCEEIGDIFFEETSILNFSILEYLLKQREHKSQRIKLEKMLQLIINDKIIDFFCGFCCYADNVMLSCFLEEINRIDNIFIATIPIQIIGQNFENGVKLFKQIEKKLKILGEFQEDFQKTLKDLVLSDKYKEYFMERIEDGDVEIVELCRQGEIKFRTLQLKNRFCLQIYKNQLFDFTQEALEEIFIEVFCYDKNTVPWAILTETIYKALPDTDQEVLKKYVEEAPINYLTFVTEYYGTEIPINDGRTAVDWLIHACEKNDDSKIDQDLLINAYNRLANMTREQ